MHTINVERLEPQKSGQRSGKPWTLFNVVGTYDDGRPLENVRTFDHLPVGGVAVELQPYTSDAGQSWTAKLDKRSRPGRSASDRKVNGSSDFETEVRERLDRIEKLLRALVVTYDPENEVVK